MKVSSKSIRMIGVTVLIGLFLGFMVGEKLTLRSFENKTPVTFYYADNYSGDLTGTIESKKVYTVVDEDGKYYIVTKDIYDSVNEGDSLSSITE